MAPRNSNHKSKSPEAAATPKAAKRAATEDLFVLAKNNRLLSEIDKEVVDENNRRRLKRDNRAVYIALAGKLDRVNDSLLKALHPDILVVSRLKKAAFLVFLSEAVRDKAFKALQKAHVKGKPANVDCCGAKSKRPFPTPDPEKTQVSMIQLVVSDLPAGTAKNTLEIIFPKATEIAIMIRKQVGFLTFANEVDARKAWDKGKNLKVSGVPVMVRFRTFNKTVQSVEPPTKKPANVETLKSAVGPAAKDAKKNKTSNVAMKVAQPKAQESEEENEEATDEEFEDSDLEDEDFEDEEEGEEEDEE